MKCKKCKKYINEECTAKFTDIDNHICLLRMLCFMVRQNQIEEEKEQDEANWWKEKE